MTQEIREFNTITEAKEILEGETYGYLWHEEDALPPECIEYKNIKGQREYLLYLNKEDKHDAVNLYCDALERLYRLKHINQLRRVVTMFNSFLIQIESDIRIYLDSKKLVKEQIGQCGL